MNEEILRGYDDLADALVDALNQPMLLGADILSAAFNLLATDMADDERVLLFLERIEEAAMAAAYNKSASCYATLTRICVILKCVAQGDIFKRPDGSITPLAIALERGRSLCSFKH